MPNGRNDGCTICKRHIHPPQDVICKERAILGMVFTIDCISDIMHISGDLRKFDLRVSMSELLQQICRPLSHQRAMCLRMLRIAKRG